MASTYNTAKQIYADFGVDTEKAMKILDEIPLSMHCWQGDDVCGFETPDAALGCGGIQTTGNFPGKARNVGELRDDISEAMKYIPGKTRLNLHAIYGEFGGKKVDRDEISFEHFKGWADWCKSRKMGMDFNPTFFSHPLAADGFTLSSADKSTRKFWIRHGVACRKIAEKIGKTLSDTVITNFWMPDGMKDFPADRLGPRERMAASLDEIFSVKIARKYDRDAVECKLFGIGSESYVVGSHEFFMGYAVKNGLILTLDSGHFHPTEVISDKLTSCLMFVDEVLLHVSRGVRWDSDHVVILGDDLLDLAREIIRCKALDRVHIGLDYFDATINRIGAYVIGCRATQKAFIQALLEPSATLQQYEAEGKYFQRLALQEEMKSLPWTAVWDMFCLQNDVPVGEDYIAEIEKYEAEVTSKR